MEKKDQENNEEKMVQKGFSIGEVLKFGWEEWKKNWALFLGIALFAFMVPLIPQALMMTLSEDAVFSQFLLGIIHFILTVISHMGLLTVALKAARQESFTFGDFFSKIHLFPSYLLGKILYILSVALGLILLIVPGIIIALKFNLWPFYVLDHSSSAIDALKASNETVYGSKWDLFLFGIAVLIINALGLLAFGVGFLITWPVSLIAWSKVYLKLTENRTLEVVS